MKELNYFRHEITVAGAQTVLLGILYVIWALKGAVAQNVYKIISTL